MISDEMLARLKQLSERCDPPPWRASVEGRDHDSGEDMIMTGVDDDRGEDIYVSRDSGPASAAYLDLIAAAVTYLPELVDEVQSARHRSD